MSAKKKSDRKKKLVTLDGSLFSREGLQTALSHFHEGKVIVLGDIGLDRYTIGRVDRISPEAPVPVVQVTEQRLKLGLAANVAENVTALGGQVRLVGQIGKDASGEAVLELLKESRIHAQGVMVGGSRPTVVKERIVSEQQQLLRVDYEKIESLPKRAQEQLVSKVRSSLKPGVVLVIEDYAKGLLDQALLSRICEEAKKKKVPVLVDPNVKTPAEFYRGATVLTPNRKEAEALSGIAIKSDEDLLRVAETLFQKTAAQALVLTLGRDGMVLFEREADHALHLATFAQEVFDVSGAGDTVIAVLGICLSLGVDLPYACVLANVAAGIEVGKLGTATVEPEELEQGLERWLAHSNC